MSNRFLSKIAVTIYSIVIISIVNFSSAQDTSQTDNPPFVQAGATYILADVRPVQLDAVYDTTKVVAWRQAGYFGLGTRVGVIDLEFGRLAEFEQKSGAKVTLPSGQDYRTNPSSSDNDHGTRVLEVIHSIAPQADLFACEYKDYETYVQCVNEMVDSFGVHIINHSVGLPYLPLDGQGPWAKVVENAFTRSNILWVNSTGNANRGYLHDVFFPASNAPKSHGFKSVGGTQVSFLKIPKISDNHVNGRVMLSWQSPDCNNDGMPDSNINPASIKLDLRFLDPNTYEVLPIGNIHQASNASEGFPGTWATVDMSREYLVEILDNTPDVIPKIGCTGSGTPALGAPFGLYVEFAAIPFAQGDQSLMSPADSRYSLSVGALEGEARGVASYSSRGFTDLERIIKPNITAPGEFTLPSGKQFVGSSAAAAFVSGVAALVKQAYPTYTNQNLFDYLTSLDKGVIRPFWETATLPNMNVGSGQISLAAPPPLPIDEQLPDASIAFPFTEDFSYNQSVIRDPLSLWTMEHAGWSIQSRDNNNVLVGLGNLDKPLIVGGKGTPQWETPSVGPMVIGFDFLISNGAPGIRMIFHEQANGYNVLELQPGLILLGRDDNLTTLDPPNYIKDREIEKKLQNGTQKVPILAGQKHHVEMWIDNEVIYVYLDQNLVLRAIDQHEPLLKFGKIIFQSLDAKREVQIDNLIIQKVEDYSSHFESGFLPGTWDVKNLTNIEIEHENGLGASGRNFVRLRGENELKPVIPEPVNNMHMDCLIRSSQGNFLLQFQTTNAGRIEMRYESNVTTLTYYDPSNEIVWQDSDTYFKNFFSRGWDDIRLELNGNLLIVYRNGTRRFEGRIGQMVISPSQITFMTKKGDILDIDDCIFTEIPVLDN